MHDKIFLILGGGGMIGFQVARRICANLDPETIVIASLFQQEVREAASALQKEFPDVNVEGYWGDVFVRADFNDGDRQQRLRRSDLLADPARRAELYEDLFGDDDEAYHRSQLVHLIGQYRPDVIVDAINTATAISYQDIYSASKIAHAGLESLDGVSTESVDALTGAVETLLISQYVPQLIRHVIFINRAMREAGTRLYLKVGTTGTGGMGLNIPYTHGEDRPSAKLMSKTAVAFAHTGLLFLMARTVGGPIVKELKPAALVGWIDTSFRAVKRRGKNVYRYTAQADRLSGRLALSKPESAFETQEQLKLVVADTGENGVFAKGEFETITNLRQMELITPEEIARAVELEIEGVNTGKDVIPAIDSAIMGPTFRGGYLRRQAIEDLNRLEKQTGVPSVALGELGPPELSKLLWEAYLLKKVYRTLARVIERARDEIDHGRKSRRTARSPEEISEALAAFLAATPFVRDTIVSTGGAILLPDGETLLRGPFLRIPEVAGRTTVEISPGDVDRWARKGWVDLRSENIRTWQERFKRMRRAKQRHGGKGSALLDREVYLFDKIFIGEVVGWVFNNEMGGYRIK
ncbi:MAG TPA: hypothetical protein VMN57_03360 [Anaerolineales bacterium]|nr:hypothetical protein [Anaerolineales bacterium]